MRILVSRAHDGQHDALVVPGRAARLAPVMVSARDKRTLAERVQVVVEEVYAKRAKGEVPTG